MTAPIDVIVNRLEGVRRTGPGRFIARCPAHDDKTPSMSLREGDDGRVLLHCWAGCPADEVVGALGLDLSDLFPPRDHAVPGDGTPRQRRPWLAADLLNLAAHEATVIVLVLGDLAAGRTAEVHRLIEAASRLADMAEAARGLR